MTMTETEQPQTVPPLTAREIVARYDELGPSLNADSTDPAGELARRLTVAALRRHVLVRAGNRPRDRDAELLLCVEFAALHLLQNARRNCEPGVSRRLAVQVTRAWNQTGEMGDWLTEHAKAAGLDPEEIRALAGQETELGAGLTPAQRADRAEADAVGMAEAVDRLTRVMQAALLDLGRGDPGGATRLLNEALPDPWRGVLPVDGDESGAHWLARDLAGQAPQDDQPQFLPAPALGEIARNVAAGRQWMAGQAALADPQAPLDYEHPRPVPAPFAHAERLQAEPASGHYRPPAPAAEVGAELLTDERF